MPPPHWAVHRSQGPQPVQNMCGGHSKCSLQYLSSRFWPTHTRPPCRGLGLLQARCRTWKPIPHEVLQGDHDVQGVQPPFLEQLAISMRGPWHCQPPHRGAGLSQALVRQRQEPRALPSVWVQGVHADQGPKCPSTVRFRIGHVEMLCSHWLMLRLSSRLVHFFITMSQPQ